MTVVPRVLPPVHIRGRPLGSLCFSSLLGSNQLQRIDDVVKERLLKVWGIRLVV